MSCVTHNLQLDCLIPDLDRSEPEVDTDCTDVTLCKRVIREPKQKAGLAHPAVADKHELEQEIAAACAEKGNGTRDKRESEGVRWGGKHGEDAIATKVRFRTQLGTVGV